MMERLKKNTRIKIISLFSAILLWMYVMAVVDPEDAVLYENVPITITNMNEIRDLDLVIDPDEKLETSIYVKGNLSDLQKITTDNINIYGTINNPIEGQNQLHLKASINNKVSTEFKSDTIVINLEKNIKVEKDIVVDITGKYADNIDKIELEKDKIVISGPRGSVDSVKYVQASFNADKEYTEDHTEPILLKALDDNKNEVKNINLEFDKVNAKILFLKQKEVKVNLVFDSDSEFIEGEDFTISPSTITIKGKSENIDSVDFINTTPINIGDFESDSKIVELKMPDGVTSNQNTVTIKMSKENSLVNTFTYSKEDINLLNNDENVSLDDFEITDTIKVTLKYNRASEKISKSDLKLYIDLEEGFVENKQYSILHNDIDVKSISISPSYVTSK